MQGRPGALRRLTGNGVRMSAGIAWFVARTWSPDVEDELAKEPSAACSERSSSVAPGGIGLPAAARPRMPRAVELAFGVPLPQPPPARWARSQAAAPRTAGSERGT